MRKLFSYLAFFLLSTSVLMLQIILSRYSKIAFMHDFQFVILSFTIWGLGLGGLVVYFLKNKPPEKQIWGAIGSLTFLYACFSVLPIIALTQSVITNSTIVRTIFFLSSLFAYILAGMIGALLYKSFSEKIHLYYGLSLIGGGVGALATSLLLELWGNSHGVYVFFALGLLSSALFFQTSGEKNRLKSFTAFALIILLFIFISYPSLFYIECERFAYGENAKNWFRNKNLAKPIQDSNSFSQLDIYKLQPFPPSGERYTRFHIDCTGVTFLPHKSELTKYRDITNEVIAFPLGLTKPSLLALIGSGAGVDVQRALLLNSKKIDAYEINPLIIKWVNILEPDNVYKNSRVNLILGEGRGSIAKTDTSYDMIYVPGTKRFGDIGIAPYAFVSNYLYTKEANELYFSKLKPDAILAIADPSLFVQYYGETTASYFKSIGKNPADHIIFVTGRDALVSNRTVMLAKKSAYTEKEIASIKSASSLSGFTFAHYQPTPLNKVITDERPYFWDLHDINSSFLIEIPVQEEIRAKQYEKFLNINNLYAALLLLAGVYLITVFSPFINYKGKKTATLPFIAFFSSIGAGYIMLQLYTLEKVTFFLGNPVYSLSIVLSSFLFFGGVGSMISKKLSDKRISLALVMVGLVGILVIFYMTITYLLPAANNLSFHAKVLLSMVASAGIGLTTGLAFPLGQIKVKKASVSLIPWMVALDGISSVIGGVMFVIISFSYGFRGAFVTLILLYSIAVISTLLMTPEKKTR